MQNKNHFPVLRKQDFLLIGGILLLALVLFLYFFFTGRQNAGRVQVQIGEEIFAEYPLSEDREVPLTGWNGGENLLIIRGGEAWIEEADCPDRLCVKQGKISRKGQMILCLPHRIIVKVISGEEETDGISG